MLNVIVLWSEALYSLQTFQSRRSKGRSRESVASMKEEATELPLRASKVGTLPTFSTDNEWVKMKSSRSSPLELLSGP